MFTFLLVVQTLIAAMLVAVNGLYLLRRRNAA